MELIFFYFFCAITVTSSLLVIALRNTLSSAVSLIVTLGGIACLFGMLGAHFLAVMQILIYAGAIMVLFLFVIMLLNLGRGELMRIKMTFASVVGILFGGYLAALLIMRLGFLSHPLPPANPSYGTIREVGRLLFSHYLIPFEFASILLLVSIIGAVVLTKRGSE